VYEHRIKTLFVIPSELERFEDVNKVLPVSAMQVCYHRIELGYQLKLLIYRKCGRDRYTYGRSPTRVPIVDGCEGSCNRFDPAANRIVSIDGGHRKRLHDVRGEIGLNPKPGVPIKGNTAEHTEQIRLITLVVKVREKEAIVMMRSNSFRWNKCRVEVV
jgi:hypothetical protein